MCGDEVPAYCVCKQGIMNTPYQVDSRGEGVRTTHLTAACRSASYWLAEKVGYLQFIQRRVAEFMVSVIT
jgi:hypothetical protein